MFRKCTIFIQSKNKSIFNFFKYFTNLKRLTIQLNWNLKVKYNSKDFKLNNSIIYLKFIKTWRHSSHDTDDRVRNLRWRHAEHVLVRVEYGWWRNRETSPVRAEFLLRRFRGGFEERWRHKEVPVGRTGN